MNALNQTIEELRKSLTGDFHDQEINHHKHKVCNYADNYYGDQVCIFEELNDE